MDDWSEKYFDVGYETKSVLPAVEDLSKDLKPQGWIITVSNYEASKLNATMKRKFPNEDFKVLSLSEARRRIALGEDVEQRLTVQVYDEASFVEVGFKTDLNSFLEKLKGG